jgi:hypothetical protein
MDISKLPRLSQTPAHATGGEPAPEATAEPAVGSPSLVSPPAAETTWCPTCHAPNSTGSAFCNNCGARLRGNANSSTVARAGHAADLGPGIGAEVWLSAVIGAVVMFMGINFARWALTTMTGGTFQTNVNWTAGPKAGQPVAYWELDGFTALQDTALFLFGFAMVLEAIVLVAVHRGGRGRVPLLVFAISITLLATALNLLVAMKLIAAGFLPLASLLAVGFGGYIAAYEWRLLQHYRGSVRRA